MFDLFEKLLIRGFGGSSNILAVEISCPTFSPRLQLLQQTAKMHSFIYFASFLLLVSAIPKEEKIDRVYDRDLSGKEHFDNDIHNTEYDHEAFLGEEAKSFDNLSPEESKRRLG